MEIVEQAEAGIGIVAPQGRADALAAEALQAALLRPFGTGARAVVVDLSGLDYISSAGLRAFLTLGRNGRQKGLPVVLCGLKPAVRQVFDLSGFTPLFRVEPDRPAAVAGLQA